MGDARRMKGDVLVRLIWRSTQKSDLDDINRWIFRGICSRITAQQGHVCHRVISTRVYAFTGF